MSSNNAIAIPAGTITLNTDIQLNAGGLVAIGVRDFVRTLRKEIAEFRENMKCLEQEKENEIEAFNKECVGIVEKTVEGETADKVVETLKALYGKGVKKNVMFQDRDGELNFHIAVAGSGKSEFSIHGTVDAEDVCTKHYDAVEALNNRINKVAEEICIRQAKLRQVPELEREIEANITEEVIKSNPDYAGLLAVVKNSKLLA
jgi:hypothetical protein